MSANEWAVYRLDFTGNHFLVEKNLTEARARELVAEFESHKHHQHYWAERMVDRPPDYAEILRESLQTGSSFEASLKVLKHQKASMHDCVQAVQQVRGVSLSEARRLVVQSASFGDE